MTQGLEIITLGGLRITLGGAPLAGLASRKAEALVVYLACAGQPQQRDVLAELLWDDLPAARARGNLSVLLTSLRHALGPYMEIGRHAVALAPVGPVRLDCAELERVAGAALAGVRPGGALAPSEARRLDAALASYGGDFLHGFALRDGAGFEAWALAEQERLRALVVRARLALAQTALDAGDHAAGVGHAQALLRLEPLHEDAHYLLMRLYAHSGRRGAALAHYEELCRTLDAELGVAPAQRTTDLYRQIWQGHVAPAGQARSAPARRGELRGAPFLATSFVGRERELAAIAERLRDPACRLLTLAGPGGSGKTRLALQAAGERAAALADGAFFVPLAPLSALDQVPAAIAAALRYTFRGQADPMAQLTGFLGGRELLLVLDNAEHLPDLADVVMVLIAMTPRVQLLVTSRERLSLQAEWLIEIGGLELPPDALAAEAAAVEASSAGRLFAQRARARLPGFRLEAAPPAAVARICRLVDGLPLAIELAAALVESRPCAAIADAIGHDLDVLATEMRDVPQRHRSLRAVFEQSWALLRDEERALLSAVTIFRGGFDAGAAASICGGAPERTLAALAEKSLLRAGEGGRFAAHELLRQLAAERLAPAEALALAEAHARFYLGLADTHAAGLVGASPQRSAAILRADLDNLRAAWGWAVAHGRADLLASGLAGLRELYDLDGLFEEGAAIFAAAARIRETGDDPLVARLALAHALFLVRLGRYDEACALLAKGLAHAAGDKATTAEARVLLGHARWRQGDGAAAAAELGQALALAERLGLPRVAATAERTLGNVARQQGDAAAAEAHIRRSLELARGLDDARDTCRGLNVLASLLEERGAYAEAQQRYGEALGLARGIGDRWLEAVILGNTGNVTRDVGDLSAAHASYEESLRLYRATGDRYSEGILHFSLGNIACDWGDYTGAEEHYGQALRLGEELGDRLGEGLALMGLGSAARQRGDAASAGELCGQAHELTIALAARPFAAITAIHLGHALVELGRPAEAAEVFRRAFDLRAAMGETHRDVEALAGLARAALGVGDPAAAARYAGPIAARIAAGPLEGVSEPFLIYLICARALGAAGDPRALAVLRAGQSLLRERAARIDDPAHRERFLHAVPAHRELLAL